MNPHRPQSPGVNTTVPEPPESLDVPVTRTSEPGPDSQAGSWERLNAKMILVDTLKLGLSAAPTAVAFWVVEVESTWLTTVPLALILLMGAISAFRDALRWVTTRYRITETHVQRWTGLFVRRYRSIRRERIRSVEAEAKLRHKLFGLRLVRIGAGQQNTSGESALVLDAVSRGTAKQLRERLLERTDESVETGEVIQRIRYRWVVYNILDSYAYIVAIGALWVIWLLLATFGIDPLPVLRGLADWQALGWGWTMAAALLGVGVLGAGILVWQFFNENWDFQLSRVQGAEGTLLRTTQGLLRTREVDREDHRLRGAVISEPLLWRWMRIADTEVITTGLAVWSMTPTILPRGPIRVARRVISEVLQEPSPFEAKLTAHPAAALRRRLIWSTTVSVILVVTTTWVLHTAGISGWPWWATILIVWPVALLLGLAGYLHLGHAMVDRYAVVRGKVMSRATAALQSRAISGLTVRQSVLQARLGLATVTFTTAAGHGKVTAADTSVVQAASFIESAIPELSGPFFTVPPSPRSWCSSSCSSHR